MLTIPVLFKSIHFFNHFTTRYTVFVHLYNVVSDKLHPIEGLLILSLRQKETELTRNSSLRSFFENPAIQTIKKYKREKHFV